MGNSGYREEQESGCKQNEVREKVGEDSVHPDLSDFRHNYLHARTLQVDITQDPQHHSEYLKLVMQTLEAYGYHDSIKALQAESGVQYQDHQVITFRNRILQGAFHDAIVQVSSYFNNDNNAMFLKVEQFKYIKYIIYTQIYVESILKSNYNQALDVLRNDIVPLEINENYTYGLTQLLVADKDELQSKFGDLKKGRVLVLEKIREVVPSLDILPEQRMSELLNYAMNWQYACCKNHTHQASLNVDYNMDYIKPSLLADHTCHQRNMHHSCIYSSDEQDEVWIVKIAPSGNYTSLITRNSHLITYELTYNQESDHLDVKKLYNIVAHNEGVIFLNFNYDSSLIVTGGEDKFIKVYNVKNGTLRTTLKHHSAQVNAAVFISNNSIASGGLDRYLYVVNLEGVVLFKKYNDKVLDIIYNSFTKFIGVLPATTKNSTIKLYNIDKNFCEKLIVEKGLVISIEFSKNGKHLISLLGSNPTNYANCSIHIWALETKCLHGKYTGFQQSKFIMRAIFCGFEDSMLACSSEDGIVYLWERGNSQPVLRLEGHLGAVNSIDYSNKYCHLIASGSDDGHLKMWRLK